MPPPELLVDFAFSRDQPPLVVVGEHKKVCPVFQSPSASSAAPSFINTHLLLFHRHWSNLSKDREEIFLSPTSKEIPSKLLKRRHTLLKNCWETFAEKKGFDRNGSLPGKFPTAIDFRNSSDRLFALLLFNEAADGGYRWRLSGDLATRTLSSHSKNLWIDVGELFFELAWIGL